MSFPLLELSPHATVALLLAAACLMILLLLTRVLRRRSLRIRAQDEADHGNFLEAAKLREQAGERAEAAGLFLKGGDRRKALELLAALGDHDGAIEALRGGTPEEISEGADRLEASGALADPIRLGTLGTIARASGAPSLAAALFEKAGKGDEAREARMHEARGLAALGRPLDAAAIYEKLGEARAAAAAYAEGARQASDPAQKRSMAARAAQLLRSLGDLPGAAEALAAGGGLEEGVKLLLDARNVPAAAELLQWHDRHRDAALLFERAGDLKSAARALALAEDPRGSAALLERAGDSPEAARLLLAIGDPRAAAAVHARAGATAAAAELLASSGDPDGAARLYLEANDVDSAVELLCKLGRPRDAAAVLQERGDTHRAAVLLAESGDLAERARLLESSGDFEGAAQAWLDLARPEEAKAALARVQTPNAHARFLLGRACMATRKFEDAVRCFSALLDSPPAGLSRVDVLYGLGRAFEALDRVREALATFEEILSAQAGYRDVAFRVKLLTARLAELGSPSTRGNTEPHFELPTPPGTVKVELSAGRGAGRLDTGSRRGVPERYFVERELGRGAMGVVYRAIDSQLGRPVAIKVLEQSAGADPRMREYFLREARAIAQIAHPNIVTLFDAGLEGQAPYLVMELVEGQDLRDRLQRGPLDLATALRVAAGVASGLDAAHARKIIHRDVKPENIIVAPDATAKLMDFGVAHVVAESGERRATIIGTPVYMAPEQIKGDAVGPSTDTYALGVVLFECLTGVPPFDPKGALYHHVHTAPPSPRQLKPEIPPAVAAVVLRCLAKNPGERFTTARALAEALQALLAR